MSPEQLLGSDDTTGDVVIADLEAGIGTLTRLSPDSVDLVLVVVEPSSKSLEVGQRAAALVRGEQGARVVVVANRVRDEGDLDRIRAAFPADELVSVPEDAHIAEADRRGVASLDAAPDAPAVTALVGLAGRLSA